MAKARRGVEREIASVWMRSSIDRGGSGDIGADDALSIASEPATHGKFVLVQITSYFSVSVEE